jgi:hypothetical protein
MRRKRPGFIHVDATDIALLQEAGMDALLHAARCCRDAGIVYQLSISLWVPKIRSARRDQVLPIRVRA